ncbi:MAG: helix-turn-helix domain-containing protein [Candidatus Binatia bacterium]|jgi:excisionase family DNA binding protein
MTTDALFFSVSEVARRLGLSATRVREIIDCGQLEAERTAAGVRLVRGTHLDEYARRRGGGADAGRGGAS